ncbi:MAG: hypothetical protein R3178_08215 [Rhodothermales bacterium]|nr:hypothetical protein [Rhodothermales bacterium]
MTRHTQMLLAVVLPAVLGCGGEPSRNGNEAMRAGGTTVGEVTAIYDVLAIDSELGIIRNSATETKPLSTAIRNYVSALDTVDFSACPEDFTEAFRYHRNAWEESIPFFEPFGDLRGEMHDLFEEIRDQSMDTRDALERVEVPIWDSWREVEAVAADYGAIEPPAGD